MIHMLHMMLTGPEIWGWPLRDYIVYGIAGLQIGTWLTRTGEAK